MVVLAGDIEGAALENRVDGMADVAEMEQAFEEAREALSAVAGGARSGTERSGELGGRLVDVPHR